MPSGEQFGSTSGFIYGREFYTMKKDEAIDFIESIGSEDDLTKQIRFKFTGDFKALWAWVHANRISNISKGEGCTVKIDTGCGMEIIYPGQFIVRI